MATPSLPQAGHSTSDDHMAISRRFAAHAMDELSKGNRLQASEKVWGAAAHALKAVGIQRGWHHRSHQVVKDIGYHLAKEFGQPDVRNHVIKADSMYYNFYENEADDDIILDAIIDVGEFIDKLDQVRVAPPVPFTVETGPTNAVWDDFWGCRRTIFRPWAPALSLGSAEPPWKAVSNQLRR